MLMVVGLLAMLFVIVTAYITLARSDRLAATRVESGRDLNAIIDSIEDLFRSMMRDQLVDAKGVPFGGAINSTGSTYQAPQYEDIAGTRGSRFVSSIDPYIDWSTGAPSDPVLDLQIPVTAVGSTDGTVTLNGPGTSGVRLYDLVKMQSYIEGNAGRLLFDGSAPIADDWRQLALRPFMDADGNGVPDSSFEHLARLQELANAAIGRIVRTPVVTPAPPVPGMPNWLDEWRQFERQRRYEVAALVLPHSGMIALDSAWPDSSGSEPNDPPNRMFTQLMFNWINKSDGGFLTGTDFAELARNRSAVEALLRRRGGMAAWRSNGTNPRDARNPAILTDLESRFPNTLVPKFGRPSNDPVWQRQDLSGFDNINERRTYADSQRLNTDLTLLPPNLSPLPANHPYNMRDKLTTTSTSDDLARKISDSSPTLPGLEKFYLGRLALAFNANGTYNPTVGNALITELSWLIQDMLSGHLFPDPDGDPLLTLKKQADMIAVNMVAFAAPRSSTGFIDSVVYTPLAPGTPDTYVGYSPQPFIIEAVIHDDQNDDNPPVDNASIALGVELYNPNEPLMDGGIDAHALDLSQYVLAFDGADLTDVNQQGVTWQVVSALQNAPPRMAGRMSLAIAVRPNGGNPFFNTAAGPATLIWDTTVPAMDFVNTPNRLDPQIRLHLWRLGSLGTVPVPGLGLAATQVDELYVEFNKSANTPPAQPTWGTGEPWYALTARDTVSEPSRDELYVPDGVNAPPGPPRWSAAVNAAWVDSNDGTSGTPPVDSIATPDAPDLRGGLVMAPAPPLYTMNAGTGFTEQPVFLGESFPRPASYPTTGFVLFVPRFCHTVSVPTAPLSPPSPPFYSPSFSSGAVANWLSSDWGHKRISRGYGYPTAPPPADFGHMPVFDNNQPALAGGYFDQGNGPGAVPWGQMVFDYFTTIDPTTIPGGDVRKVPGRININAAPWYVLAGLPIIAPKPAFGNDLVSIAPQYRPGGTRNHRAPSPAFWRSASGILVGTGTPSGGPVPSLPSDPRFDPNMLGGDIPGTMWRRLGANLALAMASYRDRVAYQHPSVATTDKRVRFAHTRNYLGPVANPPPNPFDAVYRDAATYGGGSATGAVRRESGTDSKKFGFLSVGEVANVKGFDQGFEFDGGPTGTLSEVLHSDPDSGNGPDFMKGVAMLALLDSQYLTTRGNTFTVYVTVFDRENPQASVRSQMTVDRGNTLPRVIRDTTTGLPISTIEGQPLPEIIAERRIGYFNAAYDD